MNVVELQKNTISFNILNPFGKTVQEMNKKLTEAMLVLSYGFDPDNEISGLSDLNYDPENDSLKGCFVAFKPFNVKYWEKGFELDKNLKKLDRADFLITSKAAYIWGGSHAIKCFCNMVENLNIPCSLAEISQEKLEKIKDKLKRINAICFNNTKDEVVNKASIVGRINELDLSGFMSADNQLDSFGGYVNSPIGMVAFSVNKSGKIRVKTEHKGDILETLFFDYIYGLLMEELEPVQEPSLFDYVQDEYE